MTTCCREKISPLHFKVKKHISTPKKTIATPPPQHTHTHTEVKFTVPYTYRLNALCSMVHVLLAVKLKLGSNSTIVCLWTLMLATIGQGWPRDMYGARGILNGCFMSSNSIPNVSSNFFQYIRLSSKLL